MNLDDLDTFLATVRLGSFAAVARERVVDPSVVSRSIAMLEHQVGVRLFHRTTRKLSLTEAGQRFVERAAHVSGDMKLACDEARAVTSGPSGTLRITASAAVGVTCLAPLLPGLKSRYPGLRFELVLTDENLDLVANNIDLAVRLGPVEGLGLVGAKLFDTAYRVCASDSYLKSADRLDMPADLSRHRCLLFPFARFRTEWQFRDAGEDETYTVAVDGDLVTTNALMLKACALGGMGPALLPHWLVDDDIRAGRLIRLFPEYQVAAANFETAAWLMYPSQSAVPAKVKAVAHYLKERLGSLAAS